MPVKHALPTAPVTRCSSELDALRAELRCILQHPAFTAERRQQAQRLMSCCTSPALLRQWLALAVAEGARWEEAALAQEANAG
ncbi:hypothetical protein [Hymenobacter lucidus]|uniref:Uncharacterized protein n=1 Tax=Hymenobacter lucidus TaxID=2880930 RepID=A0ABS8AZ37_9BACT|nr:hypothetical protein [Hymenobacter lucidus]MCB2411067.1 hypothetical protein [Hymenobacter lucidus]